MGCMLILIVGGAAGWYVRRSQMTAEVQKIVEAEGRGGDRKVRQITIEEETEEETPVLARARRQLEEYFAGERKAFELPLSARGTPFQKRVWDELLKIPYGETITYGELAARIGNPKAGRAVGMANHHNPISIIVPCHRVIGARGKLVGYGGGLDLKERLLAFEKGNRGN